MPVGFRTGARSASERQAGDETRGEAGDSQLGKQKLAEGCHLCTEDGDMALGVLTVRPRRSNPQEMHDSGQGVTWSVLYPARKWLGSGRDPEPFQPGHPGRRERKDGTDRLKCGRARKGQRSQRLFVQTCQDLCR